MGQAIRGDTVAHSFSRNHVHLIFSTKDRRNTIAKEWQPRLWAYLAGICKNHEMIALAVGGTESHVHVLILAGCSCPRLGTGSSSRLQVSANRGSDSVWLWKERTAARPKNGRPLQDQPPPGRAVL